MDYDKDELYDYKEFTDEDGKPVKKPVSLADKSIVYGHGSGTVRMTIYDENGSHNILFKDVWYVPGIKKKLISIPVLDAKGVEVTFKSGTCVFKKNDRRYIAGAKTRENVQDEQLIRECLHGSEKGARGFIALAPTLWTFRLHKSKETQQGWHGDGDSTNC